jgi:hypothetical protein
MISLASSAIRLFFLENRSFFGARSAGNSGKLRQGRHSRESGNPSLFFVDTRLRGHDAKDLVSSFPNGRFRTREGNAK